MPSSFLVDAYHVNVRGSHHAIMDVLGYVRINRLVIISLSDIPSERMMRIVYDKFRVFLANRQAILISKQFKAFRQKTKTPNSIRLEVEFKSGTFEIFCVYRLNNTTIREEDVRVKNKPVLVMGDINMESPTMNEPPIRRMMNKDFEIERIFQRNGYRPPTKLRQEQFTYQQISRIDVILISKGLTSLKFLNTRQIRKTDHCLMSTTIRVPKTAKPNLALDTKKYIENLSFYSGDVRTRKRLLHIIKHSETEEYCRTRQYEVDELNDKLYWECLQLQGIEVVNTKNKPQITLPQEGELLSQGFEKVANDVSDVCKYFTGSSEKQRLNEDINEIIAKLNVKSILQKATIDWDGLRPQHIRKMEQIAPHDLRLLIKEHWMHIDRNRESIIGTIRILPKEKGVRILRLPSIFSRFIEHIALEFINLKMQEQGLSINDYTSMNRAEMCERLWEDMTNLRSQHSRVAIIKLDIKKAFDNLDFSKPLEHLKNKLKIDLPILNFLYTNRLVVAENKLFKDKSGCGQGSIAGPFLFNYSINMLELEKNLEHVYNYADDLLIIIKGNTGRDIDFAISVTMGHIEDKIKEIGLELSKEKTEIMMIKPKERVLSQIKFLGYIIDNSLNGKQNSIAVKQKIENFIEFTKSRLHDLAKLTIMQRKNLFRAILLGILGQNPILANATGNLCAELDNRVRKAASHFLTLKENTKGIQTAAAIMQANNFEKLLELIYRKKSTNANLKIEKIDSCEDSGRIHIRIKTNSMTTYYIVVHERNNAFNLLIEDSLDSDIRKESIVPIIIGQTIHLWPENAALASVPEATLNKAAREDSYLANFLINKTIKITTVKKSTRRDKILSETIDRYFNRPTAQRQIISKNKAILMYNCEKVTTKSAKKRDIDNLAKWLLKMKENEPANFYLKNITYLLTAVTILSPQKCYCQGQPANWKNTHIIFDCALLEDIRPGGWLSARTNKPTEEELKDIYEKFLKPLTLRILFDREDLTNAKRVIENAARV